jgi:hypothetical protein
VSPDARTARLAERGDDPVLLPQHHAFADWMRGHARDPGGPARVSRAPGRGSAEADLAV